MRLFLIMTMLMGITLFADVQKKMYSSGTLKSECNYTNGKKNGLSKGFHKNGKVKYEANYKNGKREGITKSYYKTGTLKHKVT